MISQARSRVSKFGGEQNIFRGATFLFILYVLIKNFLGTIKFGGNNKNWGEQHPRMPPPWLRACDQPSLQGTYQ